MEGKSLKLGDFKIYIDSFNLSNYVWKAFVNQSYLIKQTVGSQFIRSIDSISANIAEGFGRYNRKEKIRFYIYARGSSYESLDWLEKCYCRKIIDLTNYNKIYSILINFPVRLNSLIKVTKRLKE